MNSTSDYDTLQHAKIGTDRVFTHPPCKYFFFSDKDFWRCWVFFSHFVYGCHALNINLEKQNVGDGWMDQFFNTFHSFLTGQEMLNMNQLNTIRSSKMFPLE